MRFASRLRPFATQSAATVRRKRATVRPCASLSGDRSTVATVCNRSTVRGLSAVRPWRNRSTVPAKVSGKRPPVYPASVRHLSATIGSGRPCAGFVGNLSATIERNAATVRPWRNLSGDRAPRLSAVRPCASRHHRTPRPSARIPATVQPLRTSERRKRPRHHRKRATVCRIRRQPIRHHRTRRTCRACLRFDRRQGFRPMSPDSARRPFDRWPLALQSRQPFAPVPRRLAGFVASPSKTALQAVRRSAHVPAPV